MNKKIKICSILIAVIIALSICNIVYAHSGRTDSIGGHKDKNNVSGLGPYHYHCGGYPAHLHEGGVCPYSAPTVSTSTITEEPVQQETVVSSTSTIPTAVETPVMAPIIQEKTELVQQEVQAPVEEKEVTVEEVIETEEENTEISEEVIEEETTDEVVNEVVEEENKVEVVAEQKESSNTAENVVTDETTEDDTLAGIVGLGAIGGGIYWVKKKKSK